MADLEALFFQIRLRTLAEKKKKSGISWTYNFKSLSDRLLAGAGEWD